MKNLIKLAPYFKKFQATFGIGFVFVVLSVITKSYTPKLVKNLIDSIEKGLIHKTMSYDQLIASVGKFVLIYLILTLLSAVFTFLMRQTIVVASRKIEFDIKNDLYHKYQLLSVHAFKTFQTGDLMSRISEDVGKIREFVGPAFMYFFTMITAVTITCYFMFLVHPELAFYSLIPLPFLSIFIFVINQRLYENNLELQVNLAKLTSISQESYNGIRVLKSFTQENNIYNQFKTHSLQYRTQALKIVKIESLFQPMITFLMSLSTLIAVFKGGQLYINHEVSIGELTEFIMYVNMLTWPVMSIGWVALLIQKASASMSRLDEIYANPDENIMPKETSSEFDLRGDIVFDNVHFVYPDTGIEALKGVSFTIPFGQRWLLIGKTGSGKTTIAELLMKFYPINKGTITINGIDINEIPHPILRKHFAYVPQDIFLFSKSVESNIAFAGNINRNEVEIAAHKAQIYNEIEKFKNGFDTIVGERGVMLSGGQKQRISIARAIVLQKPYYLFDDCLSAVDVETERNLIESLNTTGQSATSILITHRIFNHLHFDKAIVLYNGKVQEIGNHQELMETKGLYFDYYSKQDFSNAFKEISN